MKIKSVVLLAGLFLAASLLSTARASYSRFWDFYEYDPHAPKIGTTDWWAGDYAFGEWWGMRPSLFNEGIDFSFTYTNNIAGNPVGGIAQGFTYTDNIAFGFELDMEKLVGWRGAKLTVSGLDRNGSSLSQDYVANQFTVQQVYGGQTVMFYGLVLRQSLFDDRVDIKVGRFASGDDFASSPLYWLYMNNGIDGNPQAVPVNGQFSAYPWAVWAARVRAEITEEWNVLAGVYQVSDRTFERGYHGLNWSIEPTDGLMVLGQLGWTPEFFKRAVSKTEGVTTTSDGKAVVGKSLSDPVEMKGYPGNYWVGGYYSTWAYPQFGAADTAPNAYGFYWHADQMVFQETPGSDQGLTLWSALVLSPQQNISKVPFQVNGGVVYKGLIPRRDQDYSVFGVIYGNFSADYADTVAAPGIDSPDYELVFEWGYRVQFNEFLYVQPDVQWVIQPGGRSDIPNALVLGAQMGVNF